MAKQTDPASVSNAFQLKPIPQGIRNHIVARRASVVAATLLSSTVAFAQTEAPALEEIVVTAQKRAESLQDVPISVQVLDNRLITELNIVGFEDYVQYMPNISYWGVKPGHNSIYMRGVADGGDGNQSGATPSVAVYLDEQPVTTIFRNLDVHSYDLARIETLAGPQGTLFGANAQAGLIRMITNKPNPEQFEARYDLAVNTVDDGGEGYSLEGVVNFPLSDNAAIRLVGWYIEEPGYIDNIAATRNFDLPVLAWPGQVTGGSDQTITTPSGLVEEDFNEATKAGARAMLGIDLNDNWTLTGSLMYQNVETDGLWDHDPELDSRLTGFDGIPNTADDRRTPLVPGDLKVTRYSDDSSEDEWAQLALTLEGQLGDWGEMVYAGSYLDRDVEYVNDYTEYADYYASYGFIEPYYSCYYVYYYSCTPPLTLFTDDGEFERNTHELRLQSSADRRLRWLAGAFYEKNEHEYDQEWAIPGIVPVLAIDPPDIYFTTDQKRTEEELAFFGTVSFDFTESWTGEFGVRWFDHESEIEGFVGTVWWPVCCMNRTDNAGVKASDDDTVIRANLTWTPNEDLLFYATFAEGYRPGGGNRVTTPIGATYEPDILDSYEIGWKTTFLNGSMRLNGAAYYWEWKDYQFTIFDNTISLLGLTDNVGNAEATGIEADWTWLPAEGWTLSAAVSFNEAELTSDYFRTPTSVTPDAPDGTELPFVPDLKYNLRARYDFTIGSFDWYGQLAYIFVDDSWNDLLVANRVLQEDYQIVNGAIGLGRNNWSVDLFLNNITDERADLYRGRAQTNSNRITTNRPRSFEVKFRQRF